MTKGLHVIHLLARLIHRSVLGLALMPVAISDAVLAQPALIITLECRQHRQAWHTCRFDSEVPGAEWQLAFENQTVRFQHDGSGTMRMQVGDQTPWTPARARWVAERTLCWNEVCARGEIPLD